MANQKIITAEVPSFSMSNSSYSSKSPDTWDVYLSFYGEDTRQNFTSHLYEALSQKKIKTFIDSKLKRGDAIFPVLMKAIEESHASIIIFSENYAYSKWCLKELIKIVECKEKQGQLVIPVFYKVDPSHVKRQTGSYEQAFKKHEQKMSQNKDKVTQWRAALTKVANLSGWMWNSESDRNESEFVKDIVGEVLKILDLRYPFQLEGLVGIEKSCAEIESLLEIGGSEVRSIGIWGVGGIGKTTLATVVYAKLSSSFEGHCFLANVRQESEKNGSNVLRNKLFSELLKIENLNLSAPRVLSKFDMTRLRRTKVFIVLDDVTTLTQLEDLNVDYHCLGPGSRVIVTTRNKHVCSIVNEIYQVKLLSDDESVELFCINAFREKFPARGFEELLKSVITYCKGNPLALQVLGRHLCLRNKQGWIGELRKLETIPYPKIQNVLKMRYDDLNDTAKNIFLDIACFYKGESVDRVTSLLDAYEPLSDSGIQVLLDMALITISGGNIQMHTLTQEMGRTIVREESSEDLGRRSRLWNPKEVYDVLKYNRGTEIIEGITLNLSKIEDLNLSFDCFSKMTNLRILEFYFGDWSDKCKVYFPNGLRSLPAKLRHLRWDGYCRTSLPPTFYPKMIVELDLSYSKLEKLWDGVQLLKFENLKTIKLDFSKQLVEFPDLSMAPNLVQVSLEYCVSLIQIHPSILSLRKLMHLSLRFCVYLKIDGKRLFDDRGMGSLTRLNLSGCNLKTLPDNISLLSLEELDLSETDVKRLSSNMKNLSMLQRLYIDDCAELVSVPELPPSLEELSAINCTSLKIIFNLNTVEIVEGLPSLRRLNLSNCCNLQILPDSIGLLSSLEELNLSGTNVESLSSYIKNLSNLKVLNLRSCKKLAALPDLPPSLQRLEAREGIKGFGVLPVYSTDLEGITEEKQSSLRHEVQATTEVVEGNDPKSVVSVDQDMTNTSAIEDISPMETSSSEDELSSFEMLRISNISQLEKKLPPKLDGLRIEECTYLETIPKNQLHVMSNLKELYLIDCCSFKSFPPKAFLISLRRLYVNNCPKLEFFSSSESNQMFQSLAYLSIGSSCDSLTVFTLDFFPKLKSLSLWNCFNLASFTISEEFMGDLPSFETLEIRDCPNLKSFPIGGLPTPNMASLLLSNCKILNNTPNSKKSLLSLRSMILSECPSLESLSLEPSSNLISLSIAFCDKLIPDKSWGLYSLQYLSSFEIEGGCVGMVSFPKEELLPNNINSLRISKQ